MARKAKKTNTKKKPIKKTARQARKTSVESRDSIYFLKLVAYLMLGTVWLKFSSPIVVAGVPLVGIPVGLFIGLFLASREKLQIDRKIEYAVIVVMTVISAFLPAGIVI